MQNQWTIEVAFLERFWSVFGRQKALPSSAFGCLLATIFNQKWAKGRPKCIPKFAPGPDAAQRSVLGFVVSCVLPSRMHPFPAVGLVFAIFLTLCRFLLFLTIFGTVTNLQQFYKSSFIFSQILFCDNLFQVISAIFSNYHKKPWKCCHHKHKTKQAEIDWGLKTCGIVSSCSHNFMCLWNFQNQQKSSKMKS